MVEDGYTLSPIMVQNEFMAILVLFWKLPPPPCPALLLVETC